MYLLRVQVCIERTPACVEALAPWPPPLPLKTSRRYVPQQPITDRRPHILARFLKVLLKSLELPITGRTHSFPEGGSYSRLFKAATTGGASNMTSDM